MIKSPKEIVFAVLTDDNIILCAYEVLVNAQLYAIDLNKHNFMGSNKHKVKPMQRKLINKEIKII